MNLPLDPAVINETAKNYYRKMEFFCSEAVLKAVKDALETDMSDDISSCGRVLVKDMELGSQKRVTQYMGLTGIVAEEVAKIINRELSSRQLNSQQY